MLRQCSRCGALLVAMTLVSIGICRAAYGCSIDVEKIRSSGYTAWIEQTMWPDAAAIDEKKMPEASRMDDAKSLHEYLRQILKPQLVPSDMEYSSGLAAIHRLHGEDDFLLLRYAVPGLGEIQIKDGSTLFITLVPVEESTSTIKMAFPTSGQDAMGRYIAGRALAIFRVPEPEGNGDFPKVFVSPIDIGESKCGSIDFDDVQQPSPNWYTSLQWWSDGSRISFAIEKYALQHPGEDLRRRAGLILKHPPRRLK